MSATAPNYNHTVTACFVGYITQAVINNFMPLLFVTFAATLGIDMARLSALITVNFVTQLIVDVLAGKFADRIGYKPCIIAAHLAALAGLLALGLLPTRVPDPYLAILAAIFLYALGGGLIEVMVSPIVEACPSEHKAKGDEPAALLLLLGPARHRGHLHAVSVCVRHRLMAGSRLLVGDCACHRHRDVRWRSHAAHCAGRHGDHAVRRLVEEAGVLPDVPYDAVRGRGRTGHEPVGQRVRRVRSGRDQGDWRLGGDLPHSPDDGPVPHDLRSAGASTGSHGIHCQQFRTVRGHVSDRSP